MDEKLLIARAKAGDGPAFEALVTRYEKKVYTLALSYCGNEQDALDISQEVFLRVWRFLSNFAEESRFSTWLYRITVNACKDLLRRRAGRFDLSLESQEEDSPALEVADARFDPVQVLEQRELVQALQDGLQQLSPEHREIVTLRDIHGLSYDEIAQALQLEAGTVKSRLARARTQLQKFLAQHGNKSDSAASNLRKGGGRDAKLR